MNRSRKQRCGVIVAKIKNRHIVSSTLTVHPLTSVIVKAYKKAYTSRKSQNMKTMIIAAMCLLVVNQALTQPVKTLPADRHEVYVSAGLVSAQDILEIGKNLFVTIGSGVVAAIVTGGEVQLEDTDASGSGLYGVGYHYFVSKNFKLGLSAQYARYDVSRSFSNGLSASETDTWVTLLVEPKGQWIDGRVAQLYSGVGLGASFYRSEGRSSAREEVFTDNRTFFSFQVTPIGVRFGRAVGGHLELGFGYKGLINIGLSGRF